MSNNTQLKFNIDNIFIKILNLPPSADLTLLEYQNHPNWDSIRHVELFIKIAKEFKINFTPEQIISLKSYNSISDFIIKKVQA